MLFGSDKKNSIKDARLTEYSNSSSGDMCGSFSGISITLFDETSAKVTYTSREWHNSDTEIAEYLTDRAILSDIEDVFRAHGMEKWNNKTFSDLFICDGASNSYSFRFDNNVYVSFSSQSYPPHYAAILRKISDIIAQYKESFKEFKGKGK